MSEPVETYCWLVELFDVVPDPADPAVVGYRATGEYVGPGWGSVWTITPDAWLARRFADRASAVAFIRASCRTSIERPQEWRATDHIFIHRAADRAPTKE